MLGGWEGMVPPGLRLRTRGAQDHDGVGTSGAPKLGYCSMFVLFQGVYSRPGQAAGVVTDEVWPGLVRCLLGHVGPTGR